ncbi:hypothetical protein EYC84_007153 [Monilinia fructicola]|nr:hypothetical protein EYC84_007153 [Monilinia fructicola]
MLGSVMMGLQCMVFEAANPRISSHAINSSRRHFFEISIISSPICSSHTPSLRLYKIFITVEMERMTILTEYNVLPGKNWSVEKCREVSRSKVIIINAFNALVRTHARTLQQPLLHCHRDKIQNVRQAVVAFAFYCTAVLRADSKCYSSCVWQDELDILHPRFHKLLQTSTKSDHLKLSIQAWILLSQGSQSPLISILRSAYFFHLLASQPLIQPLNSHEST